jgi:hypothetical protein
MIMMAQDHINYLMSQFSSSILEAVNTIECKGRMKYYEGNKYTCIRVGDEFAARATQLLHSAGFTMVPLMMKKHSPRTHITVLTSNEQFRLSRPKLYDAYRKWKKIEVTFKIEEVQMWPKIDKDTGRTKIMCCLIVSSDQIDSLRRELDYDENDYFNMHLTLCEKLL